MQTIFSRQNVLTTLLLAVAGIVGGILLLSLGLNTPQSAAAKTADSPVTGSRLDNSGQSVQGVTDCSYAWRAVSSMSPGSLANYLNSVAVIASDNIWSVGSYSNGSGYRTLIQHWDGTAWSIVTSPNIGTDDQLYGVSVVSANDIWAVGNYISGRSHSLILHWNGTVWSTVTSPDDGQSYFYLEEVSAITANNVWAVGFYQTGSNPDHTTVIHWDGSTWSAVTSPNFGTYDNLLLGMVALATNDIWAVGYYGTGGSFQWQPLTEHWDGTSWTVVSSPTIGTSSLLDGVTAISANDIWAVGNSSAGGAAHTLTEHWNGTAWSIVTSPNLGTYDNYFHAVAAFSSSNVWAVGYYYTGSIFQTLTEHWDGTAWSVVASPTFSSFQNELRSVAFVSADDLWAVGIADPNTLAEHYSYECVTTPSATPTGASTATPTSTPSLTASATSTHTATAVASDTATVAPTGTLAATATGTATDTPTNMPSETSTATPSPMNTDTATPISTATVCTLSFADVPNNSTFYPFVHCLACLGIINGYPCGGIGEPCNANNDPYFRTSSSVTRGQLSKIVSNSAGYSDAQPAQLFEDVPVGSTFHDFVGRLSTRGYINGYPCGGAGEPCGSGNLPYFRPNSNATRGQISKIVSNASGFSDPPGAQLFEDVVPGSTFYDFVQRLASREIVNGYPCGGAGEPCGAGNLPYFRTNNNATRGQTSKIVSNAFFPDCSTSAH